MATPRRADIDAILTDLRDDTPDAPSTGNARWAIMSVIVPGRAEADLHVDRRALTAFAVAGDAPASEQRKVLDRRDRGRR